ncbi:CHAP domain containing protein [Actinobacteria bacterium OK074]|nr:CHAP domain containing protein [Actinobacteria bacterium OK074]
MHRRTSRKWPRVVAAGVTATAALALFGSTGHAVPAPTDRPPTVTVVNPASASPADTPEGAPGSTSVTSVTVIDPADYPWKNATDIHTSDGHGYYKRSCASFAAWALRAGGRVTAKSADFLGDAGRWHGTASSTVPHVGDIAQWDPWTGGAGALGHVAYVAEVRGERVTVYEYNFRSAFNGNRGERLGVRTVNAAAVSRYLRF